MAAGLRGTGLPCSVCRFCSPGPLCVCACVFASVKRDLTKEEEEKKLPSVLRCVLNSLRQRAEHRACPRVLPRRQDAPCSLTFQTPLKLLNERMLPLKIYAEPKEDFVVLRLISRAFLAHLHCSEIQYFCFPPHSGSLNGPFLNVNSNIISKLYI